jgi:hypothetical protein
MQNHPRRPLPAKYPAHRVLGVGTSAPRRGGGGASSATPVATLKAKAHRSENIVRGEVGTIDLHFVPKPLFFDQSPEDQADILRSIGQIQTHDLHLHRDGGVELFGAYLGQFVKVEPEERGDWEYDGGGVSTLNTHYDHIESLDTPHRPQPRLGAPPPPPAATPRRARRKA